MTKNLDMLGGSGNVEVKGGSGGNNPDGGFALKDRVKGTQDVLAQFRKSEDAPVATDEPKPADQKIQRPKRKPVPPKSAAPATGTAASSQKGPAAGRRRGGSGGGGVKASAADTKIQEYFDKEESSVAKTYDADGKRSRGQDNGSVDSRGVARPLTADQVNGGRAQVPLARSYRQGTGYQEGTTTVQFGAEEPIEVRKTEVEWIDRAGALGGETANRIPGLETTGEAAPPEPVVIETKAADTAIPSVDQRPAMVPDANDPIPDASRAVEVGPESVALPGEGERLSYYTDEGKLVEVMLTEDGNYKMYDPADESDASILKDAESMRNTLFYGRFGYAGKKDPAVNATMSHLDGATDGGRNGALAGEYSGEQLVELVNKDPKPVNLADTADAALAPGVLFSAGVEEPTVAGKNDAKIAKFFTKEENTIGKTYGPDGKEIVPAEPGAPAAPETTENPKERLEQAEADLAAMRTRYAEAYYKEHQTKNRLTQVFGRFFNRDAFSADDEKADYEAALARYQDAKLAVVKGELSGADYKDAAAELLKFMTLEGRVTLYDQFTDVRKKNMNILEKGEEWLGRIGERYAKLSLTKRLLIGAGLGVAATAIAGGMGGAATIGALSVLAVRKVLGAAGGYRAANDMIEAGQRQRQEKKIASEQAAGEAELEKISDPEERYKRLNDLLTAKQAEVNRDFAKRDRGDAYRKWTARGAAYLVGSGALFEGARMSADKLTEMVQAAPWWPKVAGMLGDVQQFAGDTIDKAGDMAGKIADQAKQAVNGLSPDAADQARQFAGDARKLGGEAIYPSGALEVKPGSSVWGLLKEQLSDSSTFAGMDVERQNYAIDLLKDRLAGMSAEDLKNGGISSGKLDLLRVGDKIDFGKLLGSTSVWQEAIDKAGGISSATVDAVADQVAAGQAGGGVGAAIAETAVSSEALGQGISVNGNELEPTFAPIAETIDASSPAPALDDYRAWLKANPEAFGKFSAKGGDYLMGIFRTDGVEGNVLYSFSFHGNVFGRVEVAAVLNDMQKLSGNPFANYDRSINPLHFSQMENLAQFVRLSGDTFGDPGKLKPGESIFEYTRRMAALSVRTGKRIGVFN